MRALSITARAGLLGTLLFACGGCSTRDAPTLTGRVVRDQAPVAGSHVVLVGVVDDELHLGPWELDLCGLQPIPDFCRLIAEGVTGAGGRFELNLTREQKEALADTSFGGLLVREGGAEGTLSAWVHLSRVLWPKVYEMPDIPLRSEGTIALEGERIVFEWTGTGAEDEVMFFGRHGTVRLFDEAIAAREGSMRTEISTRYIEDQETEVRLVERLRYPARDLPPELFERPTYRALRSLRVPAQTANLPLSRGASCWLEKAGEVLETFEPCHVTNGDFADGHDLFGAGVDACDVACRRSHRLVVDLGEPTEASEIIGLGSANLLEVSEDAEAWAEVRQLHWHQTTLSTERWSASFDAATIRYVRVTPGEGYEFRLHEVSVW